MDKSNHPVHLEYLIEKGIDEFRATQILKDITSVSLSRFLIKAFSRLSPQEKVDLKEIVSDEDKLAFILRSQNHTYQGLFEDVFQETWDEYKRDVLK